MWTILIMGKGIFIILSIIFILALVVRFLYFPNNIYFGFDQARDAFATLDILRGNLRVIGPPTGVEGWFHGPLYYYIYAPFYFFSNGNPEWAAAFLRIANSLAIFLVFAVGAAIFNKRTGIISALLFAFSFEQSQYAIYFNHPSLAVVSVLIFYLGLSLLFFRKDNRGLPLALLGLGLSIQFEFVLVYLIFVMTALLIIERKFIPKLNKKILFLSSLIFIITMSTFIISEIKFYFRSFTTLFSLISSTPKDNISLGGILNNLLLVNQRLVNDNLISAGIWPAITLILLSVLFVILLKNQERPQLLFLLVWLLAGSLPFLGNKTNTPLYYYSVGASVSLLIFVSFVIQRIRRYKIVGALLLVIIVLSNIRLITTLNPKGSIPTINVQSGMLLSDEKKVIDYIYQNAAGRPFAVNALSMPLNINTTWSYLFEWYGQQKYHYLPVWGGDAALGYPGNLKIITSRSILPADQFLITEPLRGIRPGLIDKFMANEDIFTTVSHPQRIGSFTVQSRKAK